MQKGRASMVPGRPVYLVSSASVVGKKEGEGPLGKKFDVVEQDAMFGAPNWEQAESAMQKQAADLALEKRDIHRKDVRYLFAGDLLGQLIATSFGTVDLDIPLFGLYGACSTIGEAIGLGSMCAWESPYGMGRPGWHIECSAMSRTHLGKTIDLHCGGQDLIFPHHENEIAQSECANGCTFARYWMHNGFINVDNQKMSKSLHNFFTVRDVANLYGYEPIRYFMLTAGYRMPLNYTVDLIESCKNSLERLYTCRENLDFALSKSEFGTDETLTVKAEEARKKFCTAMDDDLNTPDALAAVFDLVKEINTLSAASSKKALEAAAAAFDEITGVLGLMYNRKKDEVPAEVTELVEQRAAAKKAKDWATADAIRARLTEMGWAVKDTAQGPQLSKL